MILNVGPDARGNFPKRRLKSFGKSARGFRKTEAAFTTADTAKSKNPNGEGIRSRLKCGRMNNSERFCACFRTGPRCAAAFGIRADALESVRLAATGSELRRGEAWNSVLYRETPLVSFGANPVYTYALPDEVDTVLVLKIRKDTGN